ncbi:MAG: mechanosensitive ion channel family protein [Rhizobiaceae bacterium]
MRQILDTVIKVISETASPLRNWFENLDLAQLLFVALLIGGVYLFRKQLTGLLMRLVLSTANAIRLEVPEKVQQQISPAVQALLFSLTLLLALEALELPAILEATGENLLTSVAVAAVFVAIYGTTGLLEGVLSKYRSATTELQVDWTIRIAKAAVVLLGTSAVLRIWSIDLGPVLTGMGVLGAAVALAAQDAFKNLLAGFTNLSEKRFQVGDWIRIDGRVEGVVERMEFRSTLVRRFDRAPVHVPNADLANNILTNFSRMPHRRIYWSVGLLYSTTTEQLRQISAEVETYLRQSPEFVTNDDIPLYVRIDELGPSSVNLLVYCFTQSPVYADYLAAKEALVVAIRTAVENSGTSFAYPSQSIYVEKSAPDLPQVQAKPVSA